MAGLRVALRVLLGLLIFAAGLGKALDVPGFVEVMRTYRLGFLPEGLYLPGAVGVVLFELALGAWLLAGWRLALGAGLSIGMHGAYLVLLVSALLRGLKLENCGCFGVFLPRPLTWFSPVEDLVLIALSYALYRLARSDTPLSGTGAAAARLAVALALNFPLAGRTVAGAAEPAPVEAGPSTQSDSVQRSTAPAAVQEVSKERADQGGHRAMGMMGAGMLLCMAAMLLLIVLL